METVNNSLCSAVILGRLKLSTKLMGQHMLCYPSLPSTMDKAREEAEKGVPEGTVIAVDEQTAGRGRLERTWFSPRGSLSFSVVLRPPSEEHLPQLVMLASLAVVNAIESVTRLRPQIKWPNDVLINGKKVCGILIENIFRGKTLDFSLVGIGLNVNFSPAAMPEIASTATSLSAETGQEVNMLELLSQLLLEMESLYLVVKAGRKVYGPWLKRVETVGKEVSVKFSEGGAVEKGVVEAIDNEGGLILVCPDGRRIRVVAGDVTLQV
ncbi:MAG: biotin--[acetyl-CoA-carboxylase] ligase [Dehalococcoidia bacterium]|nr:biotin--[acetyl-CoA-carboxylase] ligase [Dehalococcoidia bacterium]